MNKIFHYSVVTMVTIMSFADEIDNKKLFVSGFGNKLTPEEFKGLFPTAYDTFVPTKKRNKQPVG